MMHGGEIVIVCVHQIGSILLLVGGLKKEVQINKKNLIPQQCFTYLVGVDILRGKK